ncbi:hypothetical protein P170DRAFT_54595 [Aspergillus steynii IBT 23096]|uniref:Uncharacterized protein n=1 Tax=Aspergillus steynii IBT 23096 TaxID=1392250 RepID=A0A2I2FSA7_9EURO|nr:uncharacterized protein P170DRAFT_54595 [Aspergillus steynii IBT 23096]PLB43518.1 hypothetical protein P170DRAFT_54595 [Aspergillus steynii IBT 23096]
MDGYHTSVARNAPGHVITRPLSIPYGRYQKPVRFQGVRYAPSGIKGQPHVSPLAHNPIVSQALLEINVLLAPVPVGETQFRRWIFRRPTDSLPGLLDRCQPLRRTYDSPLRRTEYSGRINYIPGPNWMERCASRAGVLVLIAIPCRRRLAPPAPQLQHNT